MITLKHEFMKKGWAFAHFKTDSIKIPNATMEVARVKANMRRSASAVPAAETAEPGDMLVIRELRIDLGRHSVSKGSVELDLTQREYELIKFLAQNPGKIISRQELMSEVWQYEYFGDLRAVDVAVRRLREKLEGNPAEPEYVLTKRGVGYYLAE